MRNIRCIAIDDEPLASEVIVDYCEKIDYLELVGTFTDVFEALNTIKKGNIDLIFLDIQMPDLSGFAFLRSIKNPPHVIFTTAYKDYALDSYDFNAVDYLLKPFSFERFYLAIEKVSDRVLPESAIEIDHQAAQECDYIFINYDNRSIKLLLEDIIFIKSSGDYIMLYTKDKRYLVREKIKDTVDKLSKSNFIRVHKSYVVSPTKIDEIYGNTIKAGTHEIPIGKIYKSNLLKEIDKIKLG